ncbi:sigma-54-dependent Fis family transcriptional regulator [Pseudomonas sp. RIT-PI-S]|uniref:sigma-54-dependent Fis family transcriptional regulator n=1 Tax=Pseudomonas sp. RIT-PI-S TaxID=3035295 RepID=UPI0021D829E7|nr:sigma-54-dependent Fis family transcriptional regulator [Pseudomonas sp. RIT-PI-S]
MHSDSSSRHVRQVISAARTLAQGPEAAELAVTRSWLRCLDDYRLDPANPAAPCVVEHSRVLEGRERLRQVLGVADGEMNDLHRQLGGAGHAVLLTDASGIILSCVTADAERRVFEQAGLWLGADWSEACEGTNGIGTCMVERQPLTIHRNEHFRSRHIGLTCSASPVFDPAGELLAVLDVSAATSTSRQSQYHTVAMVNLAARSIENAYFLRQHRAAWLLRVQVRPAPGGLLSDGLLAFGEDGCVQAANQSALNLLGRGREQLLGRPLNAVFDCPLAAFFDRARHDPAATWPLRCHDGRALFASVAGAAPLARQVKRAPIPQPLPARQPAPPSPGGPCWADPLLADAFRRACRVFERDVPLLLKGETGSGKEVFARAVHLASSRATQPFVALNCASIPEGLIESELFGYRPGSFTGASKDGQRGKLRQAHGGTLLLDEIGDMPLNLQTRLLRVLEAREVEPIGGDPEPLDVRIISASHRELQAQVSAGAFREDLYYRLAGLTIALPALRERQDKPALLDHLLALEAPGGHTWLSSEARACLLAHPWPGNVRQLRTVLRTLVALSDGGAITLAELPAEFQRTAPPGAAPPAPLASAEREALLAVLEAQHWQITRAAQQLGLSRNTLYRKMRRHGLGRER